MLIWPTPLVIAREEKGTTIGRGERNHHSINPQGDLLSKRRGPSYTTDQKATTVTIGSSISPSAKPKKKGSEMGARIASLGLDSKKFFAHRLPD